MELFLDYEEILLQYMYHGWPRRSPKDSFLDNVWEIQLAILHVEGPHPKYQSYQGFFHLMQEYENMSVESFRFQYTRRANQIELDILDQIYFHSQDFKWKNPW